MGLPSRGRMELDSAARLAALGRRGLDHLDIRPGPQVIIDDSAVRGKALDSKWNRRKCNPNRECRLGYGGNTKYVFDQGGLPTMGCMKTMSTLRSQRPATTPSLSE